MGLLAPYVLVVDDDPTIGRLVRRVLKRAGFAVAILQRGRDAIVHTETWIPDVMLVDLNLGDMHGTTIVRELHGRFRSQAPPMIAMTGEGADSVDGCVAVCSKPFTMDQLVEVVTAHALRSKAFVHPGG